MTIRSRSTGFFSPPSALCTPHSLLRSSTKWVCFREQSRARRPASRADSDTCRRFTAFQNGFVRKETASLGIPHSPVGTTAPAGLCSFRVSSNTVCEQTVPPHALSTPRSQLRPRLFGFQSLQERALEARSLYPWANVTVCARKRVAIEGPLAITPGRADGRKSHFPPISPGGGGSVCAR